MFKKIFNQFIKDKSNPKDIKYIGSIEFFLNNKDQIDINCSIPNVDDIAVDDISNLAEKYANFLLHITDGMLNYSITKNLQQESKNNKSINNKLYIDNIIYFWQILYKDHQIKLAKKFLSKEPLIKPSQVFSIKNKL